MTRSRKWVGYALFAVALAGVSLYFCFPSEALREYLEGSVAKLAPNLDLRIHVVQPSLPFGLKLEGADLGFRERPELPIFEVDRLLVMPSLRTLSVRRPVVHFDCEAYGGKIEGIIAFRSFSCAGPIDSDINITSLHLGQYPCLQQWLQGELTGAMSGTVVYAGVPRDLLHGSGEGDLSILNGSFRFPQPFLGMESVDFDRVDTQMVLDEQRISLAAFSFEGKQMEGKASGTIRLNSSILESSLDLKVVLRAFSSFLKQRGDFTIAIHGTFARPRISFI